MVLHQKTLLKFPKIEEAIKMSKKKKNYFDLSVEEQKAQMEAFDALEHGEISMLDIMNYDVPSGSVVNRKSDYTKQLENFLFEDEKETDYASELESVLIGEDESESVYPTSFKTDFEKMLNIEHEAPEIKKEEVSVTVEENTDETKTTYKKSEVVVKPSTETKKEVVSGSSDYSVPEINIRYSEPTGRILIDDGLISTPVSVLHSVAVNFDDSLYPDDPDSMGDLLSQIFKCIIACKHPAVIIPKKQFEDEFAIYQSVDNSRFLFFYHRITESVFCYVIDKKSRETMYNISDFYPSIDERAFLKFFIGAAFACGTNHNCFMFEDEDEVEEVSKVRNNVRALTKLIESDPNTTYSGDHYGSNDVYESLNVISHSQFMYETRQILQDFILEDDYYDEDDEDEDDEEYGDIDSVYEEATKTVEPPVETTPPQPQKESEALVEDKPKMKVIDTSNNASAVSAMVMPVFR